ncbi:MAG: hypothetical protein J5808_02735 [Paludibacteraceae bacterium]|nr:hypothetical protein [Paludibacteraceae bacterium]
MTQEKNIALYDRYEQSLQTQLSDMAAMRGWFSEPMPASTDLEEKWHELAPDYLNDAVGEYEQYPLSALAWAGFVGLAEAEWWEEDWQHNRMRGYHSLQGVGGFDDMDEFILQNILHLSLDSSEAEELGTRLRLCAEIANGRLRHEGVEPGTVDAFYLFVRTVRVMYRIGVALRLTQLGYKMEELKGGS